MNELINRQHIGKRIKSIRTQNKLTQCEFADKVGTAQATVALIESGQRFPSKKLIKRISKMFKLSEEWLIYGDEPSCIIEKTDYITKVNIRYINNSPINMIDEKTFQKMLTELDDEHKEIVKEVTKLFATPS